MTPDLFVYKGAGPDGLKALPEFTKFLGRDVDGLVDFAAHDTWASMVSSADWAFGTDATRYKKMCVSVPLLTNESRGQFAAGARGDFDHYFRTVAEMLVAKGLGDCYVRLGWEMNGGWYPWAASADLDGYLAMSVRIARLFKSISPGFKMVWCVAQGWQQVEWYRCWPNDAPDVWDVVAMDVYNQTWETGSETWTAQQRWDDILNGTDNLERLVIHADWWKKPLAFPEWGTGTRPDGHGGGDDGLFVANFAAWMAARNDVLFHGVWDFPAADYNARLSTGDQPKAAAAFRAAFGSPVVADPWVGATLGLTLSAGGKTYPVSLIDGVLTVGEAA